MEKLLDVSSDNYALFLCYHDNIVMFYHAAMEENDEDGDNDLEDEEEEDEDALDDLGAALSATTISS